MILLKNQMIDSFCRYVHYMKNDINHNKDWTLKIICNVLFFY